MQGLIYPKAGAQRMELQVLAIRLNNWAKANGATLDEDAYQDLLMPGLTSLASGGAAPQPVGFTCDLDRNDCLRSLRASLDSTLIGDVVIDGKKEYL